MALDITKTTDRNAMMFISATASVLGEDIDDIVISRNTLQRQRNRIRKEIAGNIKQIFAADVPLTIHWDGKLMPNLTNTENVDRLPILESRGGKSKL